MWGLPSWGPQWLGQPWLVLLWWGPPLLVLLWLGLQWLGLL